MNYSVDDFLYLHNWICSECILIKKLYVCIICEIIHDIIRSY